MNVNINGEDYTLLMNNEFGPNYRYEVIFGSGFGDDMRNADDHTRSLIVLKFIYAILVNDNDNVNITFEQFLRYCTDEQLAEMVNFYNKRFMIIHKMDSNATGEESATVEDAEKKD